MHQGVRLPGRVRQPDTRQPLPDLGLTRLKDGVGPALNRLKTKYPIRLANRKCDTCGQGMPRHVSIDKEAAKRVKSDGKEYLDKVYGNTTVAAVA